MKDGEKKNDAIYHTHNQQFSNNFDRRRLDVIHISIRIISYVSCEPVR